MNHIFPGKILKEAEKKFFSFFRQLANPGNSVSILDGDREIEWSWVEAHLKRGPGTILDFGCGKRSFLGLSAARRGFKVLALDLLKSSSPFSFPSLEFLQGDIFDLNFEKESIDLIISCSSLEHVGLEGRYGSKNLPDGDLEAMKILWNLLKPMGLMILTIPVGQDGVYPPYHRVYGKERLSLLLKNWKVEEKEFWAKNENLIWTREDEDTVLKIQGSPSFYGLGLFLLKKV